MSEHISEDLGATLNQARLEQPQSISYNQTIDDINKQWQQLLDLSKEQQQSTPFTIPQIINIPNVQTLLQTIQQKVNQQQTQIQYLNKQVDALNRLTQIQNQKIKQHTNMLPINTIEIVQNIQQKIEELKYKFKMWLEQQTQILSADNKSQHNSTVYVSQPQPEEYRIDPKEVAHGLVKGEEGGFWQVKKLLGHRWHKYNFKCFRVKLNNSLEPVFLTKISPQRQWHNYILPFPLTKQTPLSLTLQLVNTLNAQFTVGIGTSTLLNRISTKSHAQSVCYQLSSGRLFHHKSTKIITKINFHQDDVISMRYKDNMVQWWAYQDKWIRIGWITLASYMEYKQMYFVVAGLVQGQTVKLVTC